MRGIFIGLAILISGLAATNTAAASCGSVSIANMNWASAELMAYVDKAILEAGYGCEVTLVAGATMPTFTSMNEKGEPDVAPELWLNVVREPLAKAKAEGRLHTANAAPIGGVGEGWWIPPHTAKKHPELKTVLDILEHPELFPSQEDSSKGAFVTCPAGWGCQLNNANLFRAFGMKEKGWVLVDPGSAAGLDGSMAKAVDSKANWFGYYWSPTAMIGKYHMIKVPFGVPFGGRDNWDNCIVKPEQDCADPKPSSWTESEVNTIITDSFKKKSSAGAEYLKARAYPGAIMNGMLVYMKENQADGSDAAIEFLTKHEAVWSKWVPADVAKKIKSSL